MRERVGQDDCAFGGRAHLAPRSTLSRRVQIGPPALGECAPKLDGRACAAQSAAGAAGRAVVPAAEAGSPALSPLRSATPPSLGAQSAVCESDSAIRIARRSEQLPRREGGDRAAPSSSPLRSPPTPWLTVAAQANLQTDRPPPPPSGAGGPHQLVHKLGLTLRYVENCVVEL
eukprot:scaffold123923_cov32-Tisochrysis_lutea.AAC.1